MRNFFLKKLPISLRRKLISTIIWDFDGTLSQSTSLGVELENKYREFLSRKLRRNISSKEFSSLTNTYGSWSKTVEVLTNIKEDDVITSVDDSVNKLKFIKKNEETVNLFSLLKSYRHIILTKARKDYVKKGLIKIGFSPTINFPFENIIDRHDTGFLKPHLEAFKYVHTYTKELKIRHVMIGDSYQHDVIPALKYGFFALHISELHYLIGN